MKPPSSNSLKTLRNRALMLSESGFSKRAEALGAWADLWQSPLDTHAAAISSLSAACGLSPEMVAWGLRTTCQAFGRDADTLWRQSVGGAEASLMRLGVCGHVWASTLPTSGFIPVLGTLLAGGTALIKAPEPVLPAAHLLAQSLSEASPLFEGCVEVAQWAGGGDEDVVLSHGCDALVVSGGREAIERFGVLNARRPGGPVPFVPFGPGRSLAIVPAEALPAERALLDALAIDVAAYDQLGCLSPQAIWLESEDPDQGEAFCGGLAEALTRLASWLPRGEVPESAAAAIMQRRGTTAFQGRLFPARDALVLWEPVPYRPDCPLYRTIPVHTFSGGPKNLIKHLGDAGRVHSVGIEGDEATRRRWARELVPLGIHRACPVGTMQTPPGHWHHDGMAWLAHLIRFVDVY